MPDLSRFAEVVCVDYEFMGLDGERPLPVCCVFHELRSGRRGRVWLAEEDSDILTPPYPTGPDTLVVSYYAVAELTCHLARGWPLPFNVLDLYSEFRVLTNCAGAPKPRGLLSALAHYGLASVAPEVKHAMRERILRGPPFSDAERSTILDYCQTDVAALDALLPAMMPQIELDYALLRGQYVTAVAQMEHRGVPIDAEFVSKLRANWEPIKAALISEINTDFDVYVGTTFVVARFGAWLQARRLNWPRLPSGRIALDDDTFEEMSQLYPELGPLRDVRRLLGELRAFALPVGADGRNRSMLSPFGTVTGRNAPSSNRTAFGLPKWLRGLVKPRPGTAVAYIDYAQQEFGIAAALSGDRAMKRAYESGDPYLAFATMAGGVPESATKDTHPEARELYKQCLLGVQYGMEARGLASRIGRSCAHAEHLLRQHRLVFPDYWRWSDAAVDHAFLASSITSAFGWTMRVPPEANPRTIRNFPMQANGAEILRLAIILAQQAGVAVCAPVHDALLVEAPVEEIDAAVAKAKAAMVGASKLVLDGFALHVESKIVRYPDRYLDPRGARMWERVTRILASLEAAA